MFGSIEDKFLVVRRLVFAGLRVRGSSAIMSKLILQFGESLLLIVCLNELATL